MFTAAPDTKLINEPLRFDLTDTEVAFIAREREQVLIEGERLEQNFESLKAEHKFKKTDIENRLAKLSQKVRDGFEMRSTELEITFNEPERGRKTIRRTDTGETIRVEAMSPLDIEQRQLPIDDADSAAAADAPPAKKLIPSEIIAAAKRDFEDKNLLRQHFNELRAEWPDQYPGEPDEAFVRFEKDIEECIDAETPETHQEEKGQGTTPLGTALDQAAVASEQPKIEMDLARFGSDSALAVTAFKKAAKAAGWSKVAVNLIVTQTDATASDEAVFAILRAHVTEPAK